MAGEVFDIKKGKSRELHLHPEYEFEPASGHSPTFQTLRPDVIEITPEGIDPFKINVKCLKVENAVIQWQFQTEDGPVSGQVGIGGQPPVANMGSVTAGDEF